MKRFAPALAPPDIVAVCGGEYRGSADLRLDSVASPEKATASSVIFWEQDKYFAAAQASPAGLVLCLPEKAEQLPGRNLLLHPKPYFALMRLVSWWQERSYGKEPAAIHPTAVIDPSAVLEEGVGVGAYAVVGKHCRLGAGVRVGEHCVLGDNVTIGSGSRLYPRVTLYEDCQIGGECIIHSGAVLGADGFGFLLAEGIQAKIPQVGDVVIGNHVEIGANTTIDRGTLGSTVVGDGTKIDNCVQIGHNCVIGRHSILCAQVGLAGSTIVGDYVYLAGQVGVAGHVSIGDRAMIGAQSGVSTDVPPGALFFGYPAREASEMRRVYATQKHLPDIYRHYLRLLKASGDKDKT